MIALAHSQPRPDALLTPLAPGEAYAADVVRLNGREPVGPADDAWLVLAHALDRAAQLPAGARGPVLTSGGDAIAAVLPAAAPDGMRSALLAAADGLRVLAGTLGRPARGRRAGAGGRAAGPVQGAVDAVQAAVAQQEQAGAFLLAFSTLAALRAAAAPVLDARVEGLLLAQQGRVARQAGALATASELYAAAARAARAARAADVLARALIGAGSLASMRGNYPSARNFFRAGVRVAKRAGAAEYVRAGHHGLLVAALAAHDVETALAHGWAAFQGTSPAATDDRAEMLLNLADVGRQAGEYRASLGASLTAVEMTDEPRLRLPALGTAALAAAQLGEVKLLRFIASDVERVVLRSGQPFENARALAELADAYRAVDVELADDFANRAEVLAIRGSFHEVVARVEAFRASATRNPAPQFIARAWSPDARRVVDALEQLVIARRFAGLATC